MADTIFEPFSNACAADFFSGSKHASAVVGVNLFQRRCCTQFGLAVPKDLLVGGAVVKAMTILVDNGNHVCGVFTDELKEAVVLRQLAADALQLQVLIDRIDVEEEDQGGKPANPLFQV